MGQQLNLKLAGLYTHPNELSEVPDGALFEADEVVIDEESVASPRRGFERGFELPAPGDRANKIFTYQDKPIVHYSTNSMGYYDGAFNTYSGSFDPVDASTPVRSAEANQNFYFTTDSGIKKLDAFDSSVVEAGVEKGLTNEGEVTGSAGFLEDGKQVAYRLVWGIEDANRNLILGAPSERLVVANSSGGNKDVDVTVTIPDTITDNHFYQLYRSAPFDIGIDPGEELGLVAEAIPTAGEIAARSLVITDNTPEGLTGATIYTAPTQQGILAQNDLPPRAKDLAENKGFMFYANTIGAHSVTFTILAADGGVTPGTALQIDDEVVIAGTTYTAKAATDVGANEFELLDSGTPEGASAATRIDEAARELCKVVNQSASNTTVYAFYISGANDLPGKILIRERDSGGSSFDVSFNSVVALANPFAPSLPISSTNDTFKNAIYFSKQQQPEAVPETQVLFAGSAEKEILRIVPLRDSLFVLKEDGVYRITGETAANFRVDLFDNTSTVLSAESVVTVNNQIMAYSDQGIIAITETGVSVVSRPIEVTLLGLLGVSREKVENLSFALAYETDRKYVFFTITGSGDTRPTQAFVYNTFTNTWTRWKISATTGLVGADGNDKIFLGDGASNFIMQERKQLSFRDFVDFGSLKGVTDVNGKTLTLDSVTGVEPGDVIQEAPAVFSIIESVDLALRQITIVFDAGFTVGADREILKALDCRVQWVPFTGQNPGITKHFREVSFLFKEDIIVKAVAAFSSDISGSFEDVELLAATSGVAWGLYPWGGAPWGGSSQKRGVRTYVPRRKQRGAQMNIQFKNKIGYTQFKLNGLSIMYNEMSERINR